MHDKSPTASEASFMVRTSEPESPLLEKYELYDPPSVDMDVDMQVLFSIQSIILDNSKLPKLSSGLLSGIKGEQKRGESKKKKREGSAKRRKIAR